MDFFDRLSHPSYLDGFCCAARHFTPQEGKKQGKRPFLLARPWILAGTAASRSPSAQRNGPR
ncbi:hypothetical protein NE579_16665, partial [Intestinimonas massiliensis]